MSHKKNRQFHDDNILRALDKLPHIMKNLENKSITIRANATSKESGKEHIAKTSHGLQARDITRLPKIFLDIKTKVVQDPNFENRKNYYAEKRHKYLFAGYIKVVTEIKNDQSEEIITVFFAEKIKK